MTDLPPIPGLLDANLAALGPRSEAAARAVRAAQPRPDAAFTLAPDGSITGRIIDAGQSRQLGSARAPRAEGAALASTVDVSAAAAVVVLGLGLGHHVLALASRLGRSGVVIVFEPDAGLLRAVLERVDFREAARASNLVLLTSDEDTGAIAAACRGIEALLASGTTLCDHPPSRARLGPAGARFTAAFATVMKAVRTNVVTTLMHADVTLRNLVQNIPFYASRPGVAELAGVAKGRPGIVVAAGPSLARNIHELRRPGLRDRAVIIAVQTVLKPLLAAGIKPHFVTALDYHEISRRFYEGLTREDVEGVTLVVEPKANPAILSSYPGEVRCTADAVLDRVLGEALYRPRGAIQPGATVAHLAYYFARHLGCDPVILMGQDLGFTDGQYYAAGAAIHRVWAPELGEFKTLEMLEWQRIARMPSMLRRVTDHRGRAMVTDEQMSTYLVQFEREFMADQAKGLTTIDATEGGVRKQHTTLSTLASALDKHAPAGAPSLPDLRPAPYTAPSVQALRTRLRELRHSAGRVDTSSRRAEAVLRDMQTHHADQARVNRLIAQVGEIASGATSEPAYWLAQHVNQTGQLNRFKADRAIEQDASLSPLDRQKREIERDITNVVWIADAALLVGQVLDQGLAVLDGQPPKTRDPVPAEPIHAGGPRRPVWAVLACDTEQGGLGLPRDLGAPLHAEPNLLRATLRRLAQSREVGGVVLLCTDPARARALAGTPMGQRLEFVAIEVPAWRRRAASIAASRRYSRASWRGGIAELSCYDEVLNPQALLDVLTKRDLDAAIVLGADWALLDPALADAVIERYRERPAAHPIVFTQAPPGLAPMLVSREAAAELAKARGHASTTGVLLGYSPLAPQADPIAKSVCVAIPPSLRDLGRRLIPDLPATLAACRDWLARGGPPAEPGAGPDSPPDHVIATCRESDDPFEFADALDAALAHTDAPCLTLRVTPGVGAPRLAQIVEHARRGGYAGVHLRLPASATDLGEALASPAFGLDVISVDLAADTPETFRLLTGHDALDPARESVWRMAERAGVREGLPLPWIVPRITRRDEVIEEIEPFYARWLLAVGAAVIDPFDAAPPDAPVRPLPPPEPWRSRLAARVVTLSPSREPAGATA